MKFYVSILAFLCFLVDFKDELITKRRENQHQAELVSADLPIIWFDSNILYLSTSPPNMHQRYSYSSDVTLLL